MNECEKYRQKTQKVMNNNVSVLEAGRDSNREPFYLYSPVTYPLVKTTTSMCVCVFFYQSMSGNHPSLSFSLFLLRLFIFVLYNGSFI